LAGKKGKAQVNTSGQKRVLSRKRKDIKMGGGDGRKNDNALLRRRDKAWKRSDSYDAREGGLFAAFKGKGREGGRIYLTQGPP